MPFLVWKPTIADGSSFCFAEQRHQAGAGNMTPDSSQPHCEQYRLAKRLAIQHGFDGGDLPRPQGIVFSRSDFVNEYWRPAKTENRLDFQYYEHDIECWNV